MKEYKLKINGSDYTVVIKNVEEATAQVEVNGAPYTVEFEKPISQPKAITVVKRNAPVATPSAPNNPATAVTPASSGSSPVTPINSPLPGVILSVNCSVGDSVTKGQNLMVLEAMKMENEIQAPFDGVVKSIEVQKGDSVLEGAKLIVIA